MLFAQGERVFVQTCATGYCHGLKGATGGAPRLAGRGFDKTYIAQTIAEGIPGTAMRAFAGALSKADLSAVTLYVASLNGIAGDSAAPVRTRPLSGEAARGRELFSDSVRGFGRCSTCHEVNGIGIPVANPVTAVPPSPAALRALATPRVRSAVVEGEAIPVLLVREAKSGTLLYDMTSAPPVERSFEPGALRITDGSGWKHASMISAYSDAELAAILAYLRTAVQ